MASTDDRIVWRLVKPHYAPGLDGEGARLAGGRWNNPGAPVVYCSETLSLAVLECFVHLPTALRGAPQLPVMIAVKIALPAEASTVEVDKAAVTDVRDQVACREIGDRWLAARPTLAMRVPSIVVAQERNVLLNPLHSQAAGIKVVDQFEFKFDPRMGS